MIQNFKWGISQPVYVVTKYRESQSLLYQIFYYFKQTSVQKNQSRSRNPVTSETAHDNSQNALRFAFLLYKWQTIFSAVFKDKISLFDKKLQVSIC